MPLGEGFYGTNADGSRQTEYCKFCYARGAFADPALTDHMKRELARSAIPNLARWKS